MNTRLPALLALATLFGVATACQTRTVRPERDVQVTADDPNAGGFDFIEDADPHQAALITSEGEMVRMHYIRQKKAETLKELIATSYPEGHVRIVTKPDFHSTKEGGLDLMVITGPPENVEEVEEFLSMIEAEVPQIEINVRVVEVTRTRQDERGINVSVQEVNPANPNTLFNQATSAFSSQGFIRSLSPGGAQTGPLAYQGTRVLLDTVQQDLQLDIAIELLQRTQDVDVLSAPTIRVLNGHLATIQTGEKTPTSAVAYNGTGITTVTSTFENTGVTLKVRPTVIAGSDTVRLEVDPQVSSVTGFSEPAVNGGLAVPFISTRSASTVVNVQNQEVFVLGGLLATTEIVTVSQLPVLGDIPLLGELFKSTNKRTVQSEILFLLQPRIIEPEASRGRLVIPPDDR